MLPGERATVVWGVLIICFLGCKGAFCSGEVYSAEVSGCVIAIDLLMSLALVWPPRPSTINRVKQFLFFMDVWNRVCSHNCLLEDFSISTCSLGYLDDQLLCLHSLYQFVEVRNNVTNGQ